TALLAACSVVRQVDAFNSVDGSKGNCDNHPNLQGLEASCDGLILNDNDLSNLARGLHDASRTNTSACCQSRPMGTAFAGSKERGNYPALETLRKRTQSIRRGSWLARPTGKP